MAQPGTEYLLTVLVTLLEVALRFWESAIKDLRESLEVYVSSDQKVAGSSPTGRTIQQQVFAFTIELGFQDDCATSAPLVKAMVAGNSTEVLSNCLVSHTV